MDFNNLLVIFYWLHWRLGRNMKPRETNSNKWGHFRLFIWAYNFFFYKYKLLTHLIETKAQYFSHLWLLSLRLARPQSYSWTVEHTRVLSLWYNSDQTATPYNTCTYTSGSADDPLPNTDVKGLVMQSNASPVK